MFYIGLAKQIEETAYTSDDFPSGGTLSIVAISIYRVKQKLPLLSILASLIVCHYCKEEEILTVDQTFRDDFPSSDGISSRNLSLEVRTIVFSPVPCGLSNIFEDNQYTFTIHRLSSLVLERNGSHNLSTIRNHHCI